MKAGKESGGQREGNCHCDIKYAIYAYMDWLLYKVDFGHNPE